MLVFVKECFKITGRGIVVELQHQENGLSNQTILHSKKNNLFWRVKGRIIFSHTTDLQKYFPVETLSRMLLSFNTKEKLEESQQSILEKEKRGIYQYLIQQDNGELAPQKGEYLEIII